MGAESVFAGASTLYGAVSLHSGYTIPSGVISGVGTLLIGAVPLTSRG